MGVLGKYCNKVAKSGKELVIREKPTMGHSLTVALALEGYSISADHTERNVSDLDLRLSDRKEEPATKDVQIYNALGDLPR